MSDARPQEEGSIPEPMLHELRMLYRDLSPNLGGEPSAEAVKRAQARAHAMIMRWGRGEFFT